MKRTLLGCLLACIASFSAWAEDVQLKDNHPDRYTVVKGDTLWDISDQFLQNPWMWPEIWQVNPQIGNPHLIYPGDVISLTYVDGQPRLSVKRTYRASPGTTKLSPSIHVQPLGDAVPAIPLDVIGPFLTNSRIVQPEDLEGAPYVVSGGEKRLIVGAGDTFYARGVFPEDNPVYGVYRPGQTYYDPVTEELLGLQAEDIGDAKVLRLSDDANKKTGDIATMQATRSTQEIRIKDSLLVNDTRVIEASFQPKAPDVDIEGVVMAVEGGVKKFGPMDVAAINKGDRDGVLPGDVLAVYKRSDVIKDRVTGETLTLPEERAGLMMVFRTFDKMSYAIVLESTRTLSVSDKVRNP